MLFYLSILAFISLIGLLLHRYRHQISLPIPNRLQYTRLSTFADQASAGMSSSNFDIESANIREGDSRLGLDEQGVREIKEIMSREKVNFDQARLIRQNRILAANGIDPSGMPLDSKAITRL